MHLSVIAKEPRPGHVKTRLCPPCTPAQAASLAAAALTDTLDEIDALAMRSNGDIARVLLFDGNERDWMRPGWRCIAQRGGGLDERLANAFDDLGPGVIVGMETPHVIASLGAALDAVRSGSDAIGLTTDGGYWAIGLGVIDRRVFDSVPMSTSRTGLAQLGQLHRSGRPVRRLAFARDLDTFDDVVDAAHRAHGTQHLRTIARQVLDTVRGGDAHERGTG
jgi:uncharacterized protein